MAETFYIKQGANLPTLVNTFSANGQPIVLTGTGQIVMRHQFGSMFSKIYDLFDQITLPGQIEVQWAIFETTAFELGIHYVEYHHTFENGDLAIFPTDGDVLYDRIVVLPPLA
jgi:hypothetical protein